MVMIMIMTTFLTQIAASSFTSRTNDFIQSKKGLKWDGTSTCAFATRSRYNRISLLRAFNTTWKMKPLFCPFFPITTRHRYNDYHFIPVSVIWIKAGVNSKRNHFHAHIRYLFSVSQVIDSIILKDSERSKTLRICFFFYYYGNDNEHSNSVIHSCHYYHLSNYISHQWMQLNGKMWSNLKYPKINVNK